MQLLTSDQWTKYVKSGNRLFIGSGAACPHALMNDLLQHSDGIYDVEITHILTLGDCPWNDPEYKGKFRSNALFIGAGTRVAVQEGRADYTPCFLSEIPKLFLEGILPLDTALVQVSPPDKQGYCSFGVSVDIVSAACRSARYVIAQVNPQMPSTSGQSYIHVADIDAYMEIDAPLPEFPAPDLDTTTLRIGRYVSQLIDDGCTLQMGIGKIPDAVLRYLDGKRHIGIHTEMFSDGLIDCFEKGIITNERKTLHPGKIITSFCMGTRRLYDFVDRNPHVEFHPSEYVNNPAVIAQNKHLIAINSAIEVDLTGQVVSDSVGYRLYSGIGGQVDFIRGAAMSEGGKPIIALPSTTAKGTISRIVPNVTEGAGVVTSRGDVHYVVTEYGIATLRGRSIRERALELIQVAHPRFRDQLYREIRTHFAVPAYIDPPRGLVEQLGDVEQIPLRLQGHEYFIRPLHSSDERRLQEFFYSHSEATLKSRYRHVPKMMSGEQAHNLVNVDQQTDLALCCVERQGPREIIHAVARYYLDKELNSAEIAFVVREDKQNLGLASILGKYCIDIARARGVAHINGLVNKDNMAMRRFFEKFEFTRSRTDDPTEYLFELDLVNTSEA